MKAELRYIPELNIYHLKIDGKEKPVTNEQLDNLGDATITEYRQTALAHPWTWCEWNLLEV